MACDKTFYLGKTNILTIRVICIIINSQKLIKRFTIKAINLLIIKGEMKDEAWSGW